jgi:hypothetical protein
MVAGKVFPDIVQYDKNGKYSCIPTKIVVSTGIAAGNFADAVGGPFQ